MYYNHVNTNISISLYVYMYCILSETCLCAAGHVRAWCSTDNIITVPVNHHFIMATIKVWSDTTQ